MKNKGKALYFTKVKVKVYHCLFTVDLTILYHKLSCVTHADIHSFQLGKPERAGVRKKIVSKPLSCI